MQSVQSVHLTSFDFCGYFLIFKKMVTVKTTVGKKHPASFLCGLHMQRVWNKQLYSYSAGRVLNVAPSGSNAHCQEQGSRIGDQYCRLSGTYYLLKHLRSTEAISQPT